MLGSAVAWMKGLSIIGKTTLGIVSVGTVGVLATVPQEPVTPVSDTHTMSTPATTHEDVEETKVVKYESEEKLTASLPEGTTRIETKGVNGVETFYYTVTYSDGEEAARVLNNNSVTKQPVNEVKLVGTYVAPKPKPTPRPVAPVSNCDVNYTGGCVPVVGYDLNCPDIGFMVQVVGNDSHKFDRDRDGWGCESYS